MKEHKMIQIQNEGEKKKSELKDGRQKQKRRQREERREDNWVVLVKRSRNSSLNQ